MDELIKLVKEKTGLSDDMAKKAIETVMGFLKTKLPGPIATQVESLIGGQGGGTHDVAELAKGLGNLFGKK